MALPVTAEDVIFCLRLLRDHGRPNYRTYYVKVARPRRLASVVVRLRSRDEPRPRAAAHSSPDAVRPGTRSTRAPSRRRRLKPMIGSGPYCVRRGRSSPQRDRCRRQPGLLVDAIRAVNKGLLEFRHAAASTTTATPTRSSSVGAVRRPRPRDRPRRAGRPTTISSAVADHRVRFRRGRCRAGCPRHAGLRVQYPARAVFATTGGASGSRLLSTSSGSNKNFLLRPDTALGQLFRRKRALAYRRPARRA